MKAGLFQVGLLFSSTKNDGASPLIHTQLQLGGNELRLNSSTVSTVSQCRKRETVETVQQVVRLIRPPS